MRERSVNMNIGILGCGAIGSRIAISTKHELQNVCSVSGVFDIAEEKAARLAQALGDPDLKKDSMLELIQSCDLMVEAVNANNTDELVENALSAGKHVLAMSAGRLLTASRLFQTAQEKRCSLLVPSGAIAGLDAVKAGRMATISHLTLTTRKPVSGFRGNPYLHQKNIDLDGLTGETVIFEGPVEEAVRHFPQNINVAATLALASQAADRLTVRIIVSPEYTGNSHEIELVGDFGRIITKTENTVCPDNPKTSYLAVLSAIRTLNDFCQGSRIGT